MNEKEYREKYGEKAGEFREKLTALCQSQWSGWMRYLFEKGISNDDGTWTMPSWAVERWKRQVEVSYADLPENEKNTDRREADKFIKLICEYNREANQILEIISTREPWCCWIGCNASAEWIIEYQNDDAPPHDNYSHACTQHVGSLLQDCQHSIYPLALEL